MLSMPECTMDNSFLPGECRGCVGLVMDIVHMAVQGPPVEQPVGEVEPRVVEVVEQNYDKDQVGNLMEGGKRRWQS